MRMRSRLRTLLLVVLAVGLLCGGLAAWAAHRRRLAMAVSYAQSGENWAALGHLDRAIADFTEAIRLDPNRSSSYQARGYAFARKSMLDEAYADFTRAASASPGDANPYYNRAVLWRNKGEYDK